MRSRRILLYAVVLVFSIESLLFLATFYFPVEYGTLAPHGLAVLGSVSGAYFIVQKLVPNDDQNPLEQTLIDEINTINSDVPIDIEIESTGYDFRSGGILTLEYTKTATDTQQLLDEVENVAEAFAIVLAYNDYPCEKLAVSILDISGFSIGGYYIQEAWVNAYNEDNISQPEYLERIVASLKMEFDVDGYLANIDTNVAENEGQVSVTEGEKSKTPTKTPKPESDPATIDSKFSSDEDSITSKAQETGELTGGEILSRIQSFTPRKFEQFVGKLWEEQGWEVESEGGRGDQRPDFLAYKNDGVVKNRSVIQVKRYRNGNKVGAAVIRRFIGLVGQEFREYTPVFITSSSYTSTARTQARKAGVQLVDGEKMIDLVRRFALEDLVVDYTISDADKRISNEKIPGKEIPMADDFDTLQLVISAVQQGYGTKESIRTYIEQKFDRSLHSRQIDYYGIAGWLLCFLEEDDTTRNGRKVRKWEITAEGQAYLKAIDRGKEDEAQRQLQDAIRSVKVVNRVLGELELEGKLAREDIEEILVRETELQSMSAARRSITISRWLSYLPDVEQTESQQKEQLVHIDSSQPSFDGKTFGEILEEGESKNIEFKTSLPERPNSLAREIAAFANSSGGLIVFGVNDRSTVVGIQEAKSQEEKILSTVRNLIQPPIKLDLTIQERNGSEILVAEIPGHLRQPCSVNNRNYMRQGTEVQEFTSDDMNDFFGGGFRE